jgi:hypothetical protein
MTAAATSCLLLSSLGPPNSHCALKRRSVLPADIDVSSVKAAQLCQSSHHVPYNPLFSFARCTVQMHGAGWAPAWCGCLGISLLLVMPRCTRCHQMADCIKAEVKKRFFFVSESESRISSAT